MEIFKNEMEVKLVLDIHVTSMMHYDMTVLSIMYGVVQILKLQANIAM